MERIYTTNRYLINFSELWFRNIDYILNLVKKLPVSLRNEKTIKPCYKILQAGISIPRGSLISVVIFFRAFR